MIKISDGKSDYRISRMDSLNWFVEESYDVKKGKHAGEKAWKMVGYYTKLEHAALALFDILISVDGVSDMEELIDVISEAKSDIIDAVRESKV